MWKYSVTRICQIGLGIFKKQVQIILQSYTKNQNVAEYFSQIFYLFDDFFKWLPQQSLRCSAMLRSMTLDYETDQLSRNVSN